MILYEWKCPATHDGVQSLTLALPIAAANALPQPVQVSLSAVKFASAHASVTLAGFVAGFPWQSGNAIVAGAAKAGAAPQSEAIAAAAMRAASIGSFMKRTVRCAEASVRLGA
jgi:hypothetical protein